MIWYQKSFKTKVYPRSILNTPSTALIKKSKSFWHLHRCHLYELWFLPYRGCRNTIPFEKAYRPQKVTSKPWQHFIGREFVFLLNYMAKSKCAVCAFKSVTFSYKKPLYGGDAGKFLFLPDEEAQKVIYFFYLLFQLQLAAPVVVFSALAVFGMCFGLTTFKKKIRGANIRPCAHYYFLPPSFWPLSHEEKAPFFCSKGSKLFTKVLRTNKGW